MYIGTKHTCSSECIMGGRGGRAEEEVVRGEGLSLSSGGDVWGVGG